MRVLGADRPSIRFATARRASDVAEPEASVTESRALIALAPTAASERAPQSTRHPAAAFLAHLIATHMQAPQTRARRRVEPEEAMVVYQFGRTPVTAGRKFARTA